MISALLLLVSCNGKRSKADVPAVLMTEQQMVDVMIDVQIIEQSINYRKGRSQKVANLRQQAFDTVFSHYGITDSIFIENLNYYNNDLPKMKTIVDSVNAYFTTKQNEMKKKK